MKKSEKITKIIIITLLILNILFIFTNSLLPPELSSEESEAFGGILSKLFPPDTAFGAFIRDNVRKLAHFAEFFTLGVLSALVTRLYLRGRVTVLMSYVFGLLVALVDETIQIFTGRGPMISDVWLDFSGYVLSLTLVYILILLINKYKNGKTVQNG